MFITSDSLIIRANLSDSVFKDVAIDNTRFNFTLNNAIYSIKELPTYEQVQNIKDKQCNYDAREYMEEAFNWLANLQMKSYLIRFDKFIKNLDIGQFVSDNLKTFLSLDVTDFIGFLSRIFQTIRDLPFYLLMLFVLIRYIL
jgi:hypothetical protein